jgi:nitrate/nitrite transporter NarK
VGFRGLALVLAALMLVGGSLGDRYGRRRVFALGVVMFAASSLWCALAAVRLSWSSLVHPHVTSSERHLISENEPSKYLSE